jgi:hypothetical protein
MIWTPKGRRVASTGRCSGRTHGAWSKARYGLHSGCRRPPLLWLGNRPGYEPQPWPVALMACSITTYPRAYCGATYTLVGGGKVVPGPLCGRHRPS